MPQIYPKKKTKKKEKRKEMGSVSIQEELKPSIWSLWNTVVFRDWGNEKNLTKDKE